MRTHESVYDVAVLVPHMCCCVYHMSLTGVVASITCNAYVVSPVSHTCRCFDQLSLTCGVA